MVIFHSYVSLLEGNSSNVWVYDTHTHTVTYGMSSTKSIVCIGYRAYESRNMFGGEHHLECMQLSAMGSYGNGMLPRTKWRTGSLGKSWKCLLNIYIYTYVCMYVYIYIYIYVYIERGRRRIGDVTPGRSQKL